MLRHERYTHQYAPETGTGDGAVPTALRRAIRRALAESDQCCVENPASLRSRVDRKGWKMMGGRHEPKLKASFRRELCFRSGRTATKHLNTGCKNSSRATSLWPKWRTKITWRTSWGDVRVRPILYLRQLLRT